MNASGTRVVPYLRFNGQCREAMTFYRNCFGGELHLQKVGESPMAIQLPSEINGKILLGELTGPVELVGADTMDAKIHGGNSVNLLLQCPAGPPLETIFSQLCRGGRVIIPLHQTFLGATLGALVDAYGIQWMFNSTKNLTT